ncbi:hypothetical protein [Legionella drancourtii]|uniref:Uncharacterized protein n=1 Tax=Legionella drancourtii LLAP12 TaxID=658187 RepID=G9ELY0_9GAMM|nr:hypothetical protein [Legionella drancourtii]EHL31580.1 hypothetical protein LDG_6241 [Legionella drancourtii LLAP12]
MSATRSAISKATVSYGSFFVGCAAFAISPYLLTLRAFVNSKPAKTEDLVLGAAACIFLSTVVPILPTITSITFTLAAFAMSVALASMFLIYPLALLNDALDDRECGCTI